KCDNDNEKICVSQAINYFRNGDFQKSFSVLNHVKNPDLINLFYWLYNNNHTNIFPYTSDQDYWKSLKATKEIKEIFYKNLYNNSQERIIKNKNSFILSNKIPKAKQFVLTKIIDKIKNKKTPSDIEIKFLYQYVSSNSNAYYYMTISQIAHKNYNQAYKLLTNIKNIIDKKKLWYLHKLFIREVIYNKDQKSYKYLVKLANKELNNNANKSIKYESNWLSGWVNHHIHKQKEAMQYFQSILKFAKIPDSISNAAYWSAINSEDLQQKKSLLKIASKYPTTFYGQISSYILKNPINITKYDVINLSDNKAYIDQYDKNYFKHKTIQIIKLLVSINEIKLADIFFNKIKNIAMINDFYEIYKLVEKYNIPYLTMKVAKILEKKNISLIEGLYPISYLNLNTVIPHSLMLAIIRQESLFKTDAISSSGAIGIMQLMPKTAKITAKKYNIIYNQRELLNPLYNTRLGTHHLSDLLKYYDNSLILAICAYNAGKYNVDEWVAKLGNPNNFKSNFNKILDWIEKIPFGETRSYVKNVLSNIFVYQKILQQDNGKDEKMQNFFTINYQ
ncbi:MAG: lytic transglycosylase domain-containing protein, partial [Anaplasmataceae bacterium]|nr:lytic transglycosylase domain-containing protein [Anaplasmataceae bacterium]